MRVSSTNRAEPKTVKWKGREVVTGIFKYPDNIGIYLGTTDVEQDAVIDRKYHGGIDKACYLFSADIYPYWKEKYPNLDWNFGMFGENLTIEGLDERTLFIGDQYQIGEAVVEVSEPREPCFKLGIRFNNQSVLKEFINQTYCGVYVRVLKEGKVSAGDKLKLVQRVQEDFSMARIYWLMYNAEEKNKSELNKALGVDSLATSAKKALRKRLLAIS